MVTKQPKEVRRRNEFIGSHEGAVVVEWLNDAKRPPNDEVEQLLALAATHQSSLAIQKVDAAKALSEFFRKTVRRWGLGNSPAVDHEQGALTFTQLPKSDMGKIPPMQSLAFWKAWELMQIDLLTRVRRCRRPGCGRWFFAVFDHALFHDGECRIKSTSSKPEFREHRRKYMRERRKKRTKGGK